MIRPLQFLMIPILAVALFLPALHAEETPAVAPYYALDIRQGATIVSKGDWMYTLNLVNDLGLAVRLGRGHRLLGFYELRYDGPGMNRREGEPFTTRTMDHIFAIRDQWQFRPGYAVKLQADRLVERTRSGANEVWGVGLYDYNRTGGVVAFERTMANGIVWEASLRRHELDYPNYTDLLSEYQAGGAAADVITGKQNQSVTGFGGRLRYRRFLLTVDTALMQYRKQPVVASSVQSNGTYYSSEKQRDATISGTVSLDTPVYGRVTASPALSVMARVSNQNYQYFSIALSTVPVQFYRNYYGYAEAELSVPLTVPLSSKWQAFMTPCLAMRRYADRPARRDDGTFTADKQITLRSTFSAGFSRRTSAVSRTTFTYAFQKQTSNMRYEQYVPYNYDVHYIGVGLQYTY